MGTSFLFYMQMTTKSLSPGLVSSWNSRLMYPTVYLASLQGCLTGISISIGPKQNSQFCLLSLLHEPVSYPSQKKIHRLCIAQAKSLKVNPVLSFPHSLHPISQTSWICSIFVHFTTSLWSFPPSPLIWTTA